MPWDLHERLWPIKYIIFLFLFGMSLYSMAFAEQLSEVEPFKTAIILEFLPRMAIVLYAAVLLGAGLFIERFFCRYICPLGAALWRDALGIPLRRRHKGMAVDDSSWKDRRKLALRPADDLVRPAIGQHLCQRCGPQHPVDEIVRPVGTVGEWQCCSLSPRHNGYRAASRSSRRWPMPSGSSSGGLGPTWRAPIVFVFVHVGYGWVIVGLLLMSAAAFSSGLPSIPAEHAFGAEPSPP